MRRIIVTAIICAISVFSLSAQKQAPSSTKEKTVSENAKGDAGKKNPFSESSTNMSYSLDAPSGRAMLAATNPDYPVTPGDIYTLSFFTSTEASSIKLFVESDYTINLTIFGRLDASDLSFRDLKKKVEAQVERSYPNSSPSLILTGTGVFTVKVEGEVTDCGLVQAWGLTRLSEIVDLVKTKYSSIRTVRVLDRLGKERTNDLFKASRLGDLTQDPYVHPEDRIILKRAERIVTIGGEVLKPGIYQLLEGEGLSDLVEFYGHGLTELANPQRVSLVRNVLPSNPLGETTTFDYESTAQVEIINCDSIMVPSIKELLPCVYFEGAVGVGVEGADLQSSQRESYTFIPGETLGHAVQALRAKFTAVSDLPNAYIIRDSKKIPVDLAKFLYDNEYSQDVTMLKNDVVIVPFRQFFVSVSGAVNKPGRYPYVPDRSWDYYVNLAGGFDSDKNSRQKVDIVDVQGKNHDKNRLIQPEDSVVAAQNSTLYGFGKFATIISTAVSVIALVISLLSL